MCSNGASVGLTSFVGQCSRSARQEAHAMERPCQSQGNELDEILFSAKEESLPANTRSQCDNVTGAEEQADVETQSGCNCKWDEACCTLPSVVVKEVTRVGIDRACEEENDLIRITWKTGGLSGPQSLAVSPSDTMAQLQDVLAQILECRSEDLQVICKGKVLSRNSQNCISQLGIKDGSRLMAVVRPATTSWINLNINFLHGGVMLLRMHTGCKILYVKRQLCEKLAMPKEHSEQMVLLVDGTILDEDLTLNDYSLEDGGTVTCLPQMEGIVKEVEENSDTGSERTTVSLTLTDHPASPGMGSLQDPDIPDVGKVTLTLTAEDGLAAVRTLQKVARAIKRSTRRRMTCSDPQSAGKAGHEHTNSTPAGGRRMAKKPLVAVKKGQLSVLWNPKRGTRTSQSLRKSANMHHGAGAYPQGRLKGMANRMGRCPSIQEEHDLDDISDMYEEDSIMSIDADSTLSEERLEVEAEDQTYAPIDEVSQTLQDMAIQEVMSVVSSSPSLEDSGCELDSLLVSVETSRGSISGSIEIDSQMSTTPRSTEQSDSDAISCSSSEFGSRPPSTDSSNKPRRCEVCSRKVGLTAIQCRCGGLFCGKHRYSEEHECSYDYKGEQRAALSEDNAPMVAPKLLERV